MQDGAKAWSRTVIVGALAVSEGRVLLVGQRHGESEELSWSLPAGKVDPDEPLIEALKREVREETGLSVETVRGLAYCTDVVRTRARGTTAALIFEVEVSGTPSVCDPDGDVLDVKFFLADQAIKHLGEITREMGEPAIRFLEGRISRGSLLSYVDGQPVAPPRPGDVGPGGA